MDLLYLLFPDSPDGAYWEQDCREPGFKIGSSEEQQPICY